MKNQTAVRVLLVEDSLPVRRRIRGLIEELSPVDIVGEAGTVAAALALFREHQPDAVVLDLNLADGDGIAVLTEIKRARRACVVIVQTNFVIPECREFCLKLGADHFFDKAREFERVPEVLKDLCGAKLTEAGGPVKIPVQRLGLSEDRVRGTNKMIELKQQVNDLTRQMSRPPPYETSGPDGVAGWTVPAGAGGITGHPPSLTTDRGSDA